MLRIIRGLENSLVSTQSPALTKSRERAIRTLPTSAEQIGALLLHKLVVAYPEISRKVVDVILGRIGLECIGSGGDTIVYRKVDEVIKVVRGSAFMSETAKQADVERRNQQYINLSKYFGHFVLSQSTSIGPHPYESSWSVIRTTQPFVHFDSLDLVMPNRPTANRSGIMEAIHNYPGVDNALNEFFAASRNYHEQTNCYPDINGLHNLVIYQPGDIPELVLLDTVPIEPGISQPLLAAQHDSVTKVLQTI
ncbi:MAG: hypothetical protein ABSB12_00860 [Candidatus Saccharimonadales bacterium]|jgi:hypothetical protein